MSLRSVVIAAGGTAGHLFPAKAYAEELCQAHPEARVLMVTDKETYEREAPRAQGVEWVWLPTQRYRGSSSWMDAKFWNALFESLGKAKALIRERKPSCVVGFGGYASFAAVMAAVMGGAKTCIHEQNAEFGLANRFLSFFVGRVALSLPERHAEKNTKNVVTGFPIRKDLRRVPRDEALSRWGLDPKKRTLFAFGGSQGAAFINGLVRDFLREYDEKLAGSWQVLILTGRGKNNEKFEFKTAVRAFDFAEDMSPFYAAADLVVSRAGSATLHELAYFEKTAVLIPYPFANAHQEKNARVYADFYPAVVERQESMTPQKLWMHVSSAAPRPEREGRLVLDGAKKLVALTEELVGV